MRVYIARGGGSLGTCWGGQRGGERQVDDQVGASEGVAPQQRLVRVWLRDRVRVRVRVRVRGLGSGP